MTIGKGILLIVIMSLCTSVVEAQKVKYKDLFRLLNAKNFEMAEPYLKQFIVGDPEHPNANYQLGLMYQHKLGNLDLLRNTDQYLNWSDSAIAFYDKALTLINEKDIKKHDDDFYESFKRRDLRTGKFAVKLSDVHLDIEKKSKYLEDKKSQVMHMSDAFLSSQNAYNKANANFKQIANEFTSLSDLYIRADNNTLEQLSLLHATYDSAYNYYHEFEGVRNTIQNTGYNQAFNTKAIETYPSDGVKNTDLFEESILFWDYGAWSEHVSDEIINSVFPLKNNLLAKDIFLDSLYGVAIKDSFDVRRYVIQFQGQNIAGKLKKYDSKAFPLDLFKYKLKELTYLSEVFDWYKNERERHDDIEIKIMLAQEMYEDILEADSLHNTLSNFNIDSESVKYKDFISRYEPVGGIESYITGRKDFLSKSKNQASVILERMKEQDQITIWKNDTISLIPGQTTVTAISDTSNVYYHTQFVDSVDRRSRATYGLRVDKDSVDIFFGMSPSSRKLDSLFIRPLGASFRPQFKDLIQYDKIKIGIEEYFTAVSVRNEEGTVSSMMMRSNVRLGPFWSVHKELQSEIDSIIFNKDEKLIILLQRTDEGIGETKIDLQGNFIGESSDQE